VSGQLQSTSILLMPEGSVLAHVGRAMAIAEALIDAPVRVSFAAGGRHASRLGETGLAVHAIHTLPHTELLKRLRSGGSAFREADLEAYVADELRLLGELKPDVVVGDFRPSLGISAPLAGVPYVSVVNAVWTPHYACDLIPPATWWPTRVFGRRLIEVGRRVLQSPIMAHYAKPFDRVRRRHGLGPLGDIRDCMCSRDLNLLPDLATVFPSKVLPESFHYVGPVLWEPALPDPPWLADLDRNLETVYVTMGSTGPVEQIKSIADGLLRMGLQVVCTTGSGDTELCPGEERFHAVRYAPGGKLCEMADVVVCHAGNGTIYQALSRGTPIVGIPEFHDQEFNMQRVEALGLGRRVSNGRHLVRDVLDAVDAVRSDSAYQQRAGEVQELIAQTDAPASAAAYILGAAGLKSPSDRPGGAT